MVTTAEPPNCTTHRPLPVLDRSGTTHCYNCIIESFQTQGYNLARRMLNDWALAEDALQESLVSGYRSFHQFRGDNLKAWIMRIIAHACRDMLRSRKARPTVPLDPLATDIDDPSSIPSAVNLASSQESPEDNSERQELNRAIQAGLDSLPDEQRLAVLLVDVQGMDYEEASVAMNCSLAIVSGWLIRRWKSTRYTGL